MRPGPDVPKAVKEMRLRKIHILATAVTLLFVVASLLRI
jgi:hypothetical protein